MCIRDSPHAPPLRESLPPEGAFLPWGGPAAKRPPRSAATRVAAPRGGVFALGRPGGKKNRHEAGFFVETTKRAQAAGVGFSAEDVYKRQPQGQGRRVPERRRPPPAPVVHRPHLRRPLPLHQRQGQQPRRPHPPGRDEDRQDHRAAQRVGRARPAAAALSAHRLRLRQRRACLLYTSRCV